MDGVRHGLGQTGSCPPGNKYLAAENRTGRTPIRGRPDLGTSPDPSRGAEAWNGGGVGHRESDGLRDPLGGACGGVELGGRHEPTNAALLSSETPGLDSPNSNADSEGAPDGPGLALVPVRGGEKPLER